MGCVEIDQQASQPKDGCKTRAGAVPRGGLTSGWYVRPVPRSSALSEWAIAKIDEISAAVSEKSVSKCLPLSDGASSVAAVDRGRDERRALRPIARRNMMTP